MSQAIQNLFAPVGLGVKPAAAADLFSGEGGGAAFSDVLAGESSRRFERGDAAFAEPVERGGLSDVDRKDDVARAGADRGDRGDHASSEPAVADEPTAGGAEVERTNESGVSAGAGDREAGEPGDSSEGVEPAVADDEPGVAEPAAATPEVVAAADAAAAAGAAVASAGGVSVAEAAQAGQGGRAQQPGVGERRGAVLGAGSLASPDGAVSAQGIEGTRSDAVSPIAPASAAAQAARQDAEAAPLLLQASAASSASASPASETSAASPAAPAASPAGATQPAVNTAPGPIALQGATVSAGEQLAQAHAARSDENAALNNARLARGLASAVNQKGGAVTLRLTPPEMGTVRIQMQLSGTTLAASFHAETASAHSLLTQQLGQLRSSLETQGLHVERLNVQPMAQTQQSGNASSQGDDAQQPNQQPNDGRSRGQGERGGGDRRDTQRDGGSAHDGTGQQPATFDEHLGSAPAE